MFFCSVGLKHGVITTLLGISLGEVPAPWQMWRCGYEEDAGLALAQRGLAAFVESLESRVK